MNASKKTAPGVYLLLRFFSLLLITNILNTSSVKAMRKNIHMAFTSQQQHCFTAVHASQGWLGLAHYYVFADSRILYREKGENSHARCRRCAVLPRKCIQGASFYTNRSLTWARVSIVCLHSFRQGRGCGLGGAKHPNNTRPRTAPGVNARLHSLVAVGASFNVSAAGCPDFIASFNVCAQPVNSCTIFCTGGNASTVAKPSVQSTRIAETLRRSCDLLTDGAKPYPPLFQHHHHAKA